MALLGAACEDDYKNYPDGYDRQYYTTFDYESDDQGNPTLTNRTISVDRSSTELIELPIKFMSETERDYDIEVRLYVRNSPLFSYADGSYETLRRTNSRLPTRWRFPVWISIFSIGTNG